MKKIHGFLPVYRLVPIYRLALFFLRHPRSLEVSMYNSVIFFVYIFMMCGLLLVKFCILNCRVLVCIGDIGLQLYSCRCIIWTMRLCSSCSIPVPVSIPGQFTPSNLPWFQTAGFGVFAGRAFKKDEIVMSSWMTLFLPMTFPWGLSPWYYASTHNETHTALPLGNGLIANHHESANVNKELADNSKDVFVFKVCGIFNLRIATL